MHAKNCHSFVLVGGTLPFSIILYTRRVINTNKFQNWRQKTWPSVPMPRTWTFW